MIAVAAWSTLGPILGFAAGYGLMEIAEGDPEDLRAAFFVVTGYGTIAGSALGLLAGTVHAFLIVRRAP